MRDEVGNAVDCVRALLAEPFDEVVVLDDGSTDGTAEALAIVDDPRLTVLRGAPLPDGWVGKAWACDQLGRAARGEILVFVDADVRLLPGAVGALVDNGADVVSALPDQHLAGAGDALVVPLLHLTYASWLPLRLIRWARDPRVVAANGQVLAVRKAAWDQIGGFGAVHRAIVDDMAFCAAAIRAGATVDFVDGQHLAVCRMYGSLRGAVDGFSKNLCPGVGGPGRLVAVSGLYVACFLASWVLAPVAPLAAAGIGLNLVQRALLAARYRQPAWTIGAHPVSVVLFLAIAARSIAWTRARTLRWRGRLYAEGA
jgi:hypothetical protein